MNKQNDPITEELQKNFQIPQRLEPENVEKMIVDNQRSKIKVKSRIISSAAAIAVAAGVLTYAGANGAFKKDDSRKLTTDSISDSSVADDSGKNNGGNKDKPIIIEDKDNNDAKEINGLKTLSYGELGSMIAKSAGSQRGMYSYGNKAEDATIADEAEEAPNNEGGKGGGKGGGGGEHSDTYEQVAGVVESDIVKTDGENIFYTTNGQLFAFKADDGILNKVEIDFTSLINDGFEFSTVEDMYLVDDRLTVVIDGQNMYYWWGVKADNDSDNNDELPAVSIITFDVSDINNIREVSRNTQQGYYIESRMIGTDVYVSTYSGLYYYYDFGVEENEVDATAPDFVPSYTENGTKYYFPAEDILVTEDSTDFSGYTVVSVYNTENGQRKAGKAKLGSYANIYMTADQLYLFSYYYEQRDVEDFYYWGQNEKTQIISFDISDGSMATTGNVIIEGVINDRFWLGNFGDTFCAAVHVYSYEDELNFLYTFDKNLNVLGKSQAFGEREQIKSVTYRDNIAYVVTFVQTDPLFAIDVSDPTAPTIVSELQMPGFSTHLRAFSEGRMIGFGNTANDEKGTITGLKLSMYDTTDPNAVTELSNVELKISRDEPWIDDGDISYYEYYYSVGTYDEKALLIDANKNIIAFPYTYMNEMYDYSGDDYNYVDNYTSGVKFYSYSDEKGFVPLGSYETSATYTNNDYSYFDYQTFYRIIYIDDVLYLFSDTGVVSLSMNDYSVISEFSLKEYLDEPYWYWTDDIDYAIE